MMKASDASQDPHASGLKSSGILGWIESVGNKLPDPVTLFFLGALAVWLGSEIAVQVGWEVTNPATGEVERAKSLVSSEGMQWVWRHVVENFTGFAPLGVVLVGMIGIGVAERSGFLGALLKGMITLTPQALITPALVFVGVMSSFALDAGYIVLPPLAAALFLRSGRAPMVGMAAVFSGVSAGFSANLLITGLDPLLQSFTQESARILNPDYNVDIRCNYYFMIASTFLLTGIGWAVTHFITEPRFSPEEVQEQIKAARLSGAASEQEESSQLTAVEKRGIWISLATVALGTVFLFCLILIDGAPLNGFIEPRPGWQLPVWVDVIVPMLFFLFILSGLSYGIATGSIRSDRDAARMMNETMSGMGSYIIMAFFAAQFISWFGESNMGKLIALQGVAILQKLSLPNALYVVAIILLAGGLNLFIGSASAKWALISTVFVPIFMGVGISPELTQAAYRVGDSVTNVIAPLNPYLVIILVFMRNYIPKAGLGTLVSVMLPYSIAFLIGWIIMIVAWMFLGLPLGPGDSPMFIDPIGK
jgi:aminobenzoyl-glutamate transport protein